MTNTPISAEVSKNLGAVHAFDRKVAKSNDMAGTLHKGTRADIRKAMSDPRGGDVHVDVPLTTYSIKWMQDQMNFVAGTGAPLISTPNRSNKYYVFSRDDFFRDEMEPRASGTESSGSGFNLSTDEYYCDKFAHHKDVDDDDRDNEDMVVDLYQSATEFVSQKALIKEDVLFADEFIKTGVWDTDDSTAHWSGTGATDPIEDIYKAKTAIQRKTGYRPNRMVMGQEVYDRLITNDDILARITGGSTNGSPAMVNQQLLAALFGLEQITIAGGVRNTANRKADSAAQKAATDFIIKDQALLYYAPATLGRNTVTALSKFGWSRPGYAANGLQIKRFRFEAKECVRVEVNLCRDYKVNSPELGYFFSDLDQ